MRVLIVDDDRTVRDALRRALTLGGYDVDCATGGEEGLERQRAAACDVLVLDVLMPDVDGLEVCRRLRAAGDRVPILMLTARDGVADRIGGLDAGADDYLAKPFDVGELKARLRALVRRVGKVDDPRAMAFCELRLEPDAQGVCVAEGFVALTRTEYQVLDLLMRHPRRVLSQQFIYDRVWGYDFGPASSALRVYIRYLRRKLQIAGARELIHTVHGVGYTLREP